jgi:hypothetical protein
MVVITVSIISLHEATPTSSFLGALQAGGIEPITIARVIQWVINPTHADELLNHNWDFMLILGPGSMLPTDITALCAKVFSIQLQEADDFPETFTPATNRQLVEAQTPHCNVEPTRRAYSFTPRFRALRPLPKRRSFDAELHRLPPYK